MAEVCTYNLVAIMLMVSSVTFFCGTCVDAKNLCQIFILAAIEEYSLNVSVVKLITILLEFLTSFAAFAADLA